MVVPPDNRERRLTQPAPSTTPAAAMTPKIGLIVPGQANDVAAEAAELVAWEWHLADEREYPPGLEHCSCACPWCNPGGWSV